ncbi:MAG: acyl-CoA thioesterase [Ignavibacteriales bacterium]|nr:acyl-CoA thioesterase [Ignavibacteriales bacterium]
MDTFKHYISLRVRFNEVDMLGVCNNAVYISFFEEGRLQYLKHLGLIPSGGLFSDGSLFFMVRNEINYLGHSHYDDELHIYNRVSYIKHSSYGFEHIVFNNTSQKIVAEGSGVIVRVDPETRKSTALSQEFFTVVQEFESNVRII